MGCLAALIFVTAHVSLIGEVALYCNPRMPSSVSVWRRLAGSFSQRQGMRNRAAHVGCMAMASKKTILRALQVAACRRAFAGLGACTMMLLAAHQLVVSMPLDRCTVEAA
jgi:hypothetical protein